MAICYDKQIVRLVADALGVPVPREICLEPDQELPARADLYPALIKPNQGDGSVGITKDAVVRSAAEAERYVAWLRRELPGRALLLQEYLPGPEYGVGLIGNPGSELEALPVLEVDFTRLPAGLAPILSLESKTLPDSPYWTEIRFRRAEADDAACSRAWSATRNDCSRGSAAATMGGSTSAAPPMASRGCSRSTPTPPGPTTASSRSWPASPASHTPTC